MSTNSYKIRVDFDINATSILIDRTLEKLLVPDFLPNTIKELVFHFEFSLQIKPGMIPIGTHTVIFRGIYNHEFEPNTFPMSVECIKIFGCRTELKNLPLGLKTLSIGSASNIDQNIPDISLLTLLTSYSLVVCESTKNIPNGVTDLHIYYYSALGDLSFDIPDSVENVFVSYNAITKSDSIHTILQQCKAQKIILISNGEISYKIIPQKINALYDFTECDKNIYHDIFIINGYENLFCYYITNREKYYNKLKSQINFLNTDNTELRTQLFSLSTNNAELNTKNTELNIKNAELRAKNEEMKKYLLQIINIMNNKNNE